jgi:hypothetical protein
MHEENRKMATPSRTVWTDALLVALIGLVVLAAPASRVRALEKAEIPAFPGAEGAGAFTPGGRGGKVFEVTHLGDSGPGSLREAVQAQGPRIVVFRVSGIITLQTPLKIAHPYITIAGQTAPGDGICLRGQTTEINTHDVVIRYLRFRRGEAKDRNDALGGYPVGNLIVDHCSASWGLDENLSFYRYMKKMPAGPDKKTPTENVTVQWCISSEALNPNNHAFGATWGGKNGSFHHNLFACNTGRNPSIGWGDHVDFRNNVLFNWRHRTVDGGDASSMVNIVANYYKPGPATNEGAIRHRICCPQHLDMHSEAQRDGRWYVADNFVVGSPRVTADNWDTGVQFDSEYGTTEAAIKALIQKVRATTPIPAAPITQQSAEQAYELVLAQVGATLPRRDSVDARIIDMVRTGKPASGNGIINSPADVGGWPEYRSSPAPADSDHDGMPDDWEQKFNLKRDDPADGPKDADGDGYTNVEEWLNSTDPTVGDVHRNANPQSEIRNPKLGGPVDWQAKWITAPRTDKDPLPIFRKAVRFDKPVKEAIIHICGLGHYELTINGRRVGDHEMDPGWTNYRKTCLYSSYNVTDLLTPGDNAIGVILGNGMYNVPGGRYVKFKGTFGPPKLICQMHVTFADGSAETLVSDGTWKWALGPITFTCIYGGEDYDARREQAGWDRPGFDDKAWSAAEVCEGPGGRLTAQYAPPVKVADYLPAAGVQRLKDGEYEIDCGTNLSARPRIKVRGPAGSQVMIKVAEKRGQPWTANGGHVYTYTLKGQGEEVFRPRFTYFSFQYLYISGVSRPADARQSGMGLEPMNHRQDADVTKSRGQDARATQGQDALATPEGATLLLEAGSEFLTSSAADVGGFQCSNALFNDIDAMIERSVRSNLQSVLTDCPHREKLGWLEVAHLMGPSILYHYDAHGLFRKICRDTTESQLDNGLVPDIAPEYTRFQGGFFESPEWGSACVQLPNLLYQWYGDRDTEKQQYETMTRYVHYLASTRSDRGLVKPGLGDWYDWTPEKGHVGAAQLTPAELPATAFLYDNARILARVAGSLGKTEDAAQFDGLARQVRQDFLRAYCQPAKHSVATGSQAALATALYFGLVPEEDRERVLANLVAELEKAQYRQSTGEVCFRMLVQALADAGRSDVVYRMINRTDPPGYGHMLQLGFKTLSERWDKPGSSMNHCMFGHIQEWFQGSILGIRQAPDSMGFQHLLLRPEPVGDLTWASGYYDSIHGRVKSRWRIEERRFHWQVTVPPGATAEVHVPATDAGQVSAAGQFLRMEPARGKGNVGRAVYEVGSGQYEFRASF